MSDSGLDPNAPFLHDLLDDLTDQELRQLLRWLWWSFQLVSRNSIKRWRQLVDKAKDDGT